MDPVLHRLGLGHLEERERGSLTGRVGQVRRVVPLLLGDSGVLQPGVPGLEAVRRLRLDVAEGIGPERRESGGIRRVDREAPRGVHADNPAMTAQSRATNTSSSRVRSAGLPDCRSQSRCSSTGAGGQPAIRRPAATSQSMVST